MVEIIVALIAVFGAVLPYLFQKNKELNLKIAEQKREAYANFLKNFTTVAVAVMHDEDASGKDADMERMFARDQLLLYASDDVIRPIRPHLTIKTEIAGTRFERKLWLLSRS